MTEIEPVVHSVPSGAPATQVLTFLIADVRGYTRYTVEHGDEAAAALAARFADIVDEVAGEHGGRVVELRGDEALCAFPSARQGLRAGTALQERCEREMAADPSLHLKVGAGIHAGDAVPVGDGYRGGALNLAARLCSLAAAGEVLASTTVADLAGRMSDLTFTERGLVSLKGFSTPIPVVRVSAGSDGREIEPTHTTRDASASLPIGGFLGALPSGAMVARDEERTAIGRTVEDVANGRGVLILLYGEPGVGKTRLAQEMTLLARDRGFQVATGRCYEPYSAVPLYPFREAIAGAVASAPPEVVSQAGRRWPHLARLLPDGTIPAPPPASTTHEEQQRLFWAVTGFLHELAAAHPLALLLDDLQWADGSSVELLQHLARHLHADRVLLGGTYRDAEVGPDHPLDRAILDLRRERLVRTVPLTRLTKAGTAALIAEAIGHAEVDSTLVGLVHRQTDGNPFFSEELLRSLVERGDVYEERGRWTSRDAREIDTPETLRAVIRQRVQRLSPDAQRTLSHASVMGQRFDFDDLLALLSSTEGEGAGGTEDDLELRLEEGVRAGVLREAEGDAFAFNHALTQGALYAEIPPRRRRRLHLAVAEVLERLPQRRRTQRAAELAWHFIQGGDAVRGLPFSVMAGDQAETVFSHADAEVHYRAALELAEQIGDPGLEAQARERLGSLLTATIKYRAALEMDEAAAGLYRAAGDVESEGRVVAQIGRIHVVNGTVTVGIDRLERYLDTGLPDGRTASAANLRSSLAGLYFAAERYDDALAGAESAEHLAHDLGLGGVEAESEVRRGASLAMVGRGDEAHDVLTMALDRAAGANDLFSRCRAAQYLSGLYLARGGAGTSHDYLSLALDLAERMGNQRQIAVSSFGLSLAAVAGGDADSAATHAERALSTMHAIEGSWRTAVQITGFDGSSLPSDVLSAAPHYVTECLRIVAAEPLR